MPALRGIAPETVVVQPIGRGTAPAILYALARLATLGHDGPVAILPSDHYVSDDRAFMSAVSDAADVTRDHPDRVVLLGIFPDRPEAGYGWIEPAEPLASHATRAVYAVRRFWEKPAPAVTERLREAGAFWNSFDLFRPLAIAHGSRAVADAVYAVVAPVDFSRDVPQAQPDALAVLPVSGVEWNDLGDPERVRATRRQVDWMPGTA